MSIEETGRDEMRFAVEILGVKVGTADGWDQYGDTGMQFQAFVPEEKFEAFFYGDVEPDIICFDPFNMDKNEILIGFLDETEIKYDYKEFLKLILAVA